MLRGFSILVLLILLWSCSNEPELEVIQVSLRSKSFNLGSHNLTGLQTDDRGVKIIFESGLGSDGYVWRDIALEVGKTDQSTLYNRGGYASSQLGPSPRNLVQLSDELLLVKQSIAPNEKVILVGHSWGGAIIRTFAVRFPEHVLGLVFVDTSHELELILSQDQEDEIARNYAGLIGAVRESEQLIEGVEYLKTLGNLPDVPTTALTNSPSGYSSDWASYHRRLRTGLSSGNFEQVITNTGHNIHTNEPELVVEAILGVIERLN